MKKFTVSSIAIIVSMGLAISMGISHDMLPNSSGTVVPIAKVVKNLYAAGYQSINEVEYDDGIYKAKVISNEGKEQKLSISAATGNVPTRATKEVKTISLLDAIQVVETAGCNNISEIENKQSYFELKCINADNQRTEVEVNAQSGKIQRTTYED